MSSSKRLWLSASGWGGVPGSPPSPSCQLPRGHKSQKEDISKHQMNLAPHLAPVPVALRNAGGKEFLTAHGNKGSCIHPPKPCFKADLASWREGSLHPPGPPHPSPVRSLQEGRREARAASLAGPQLSGTKVVDQCSDRSCQLRQGAVPRGRGLLLLGSRPSLSGSIHCSGRSPPCCLPRPPGSETLGTAHPHC